MPSTREGEAARRYYNLPPQHAVPIRKLVGISNELGGPQSSKYSLIHGNIQMELAANPRYERRLTALRLAETALSQRVLRADGSASVVHDGSALLAHTPVIRYGWNPAARDLTRKNIGGLLRSHRKNMMQCDSLRGLHGEFRGQVSELLMLLLFAHCDVEGFKAWPSLERQDRAEQMVDGKAYRWDVTGYSTGETLPAGEYRVQVKSGRAKSVAAYHPDIIPINTDQVFGAVAVSSEDLCDLGMEIVNQERHRVLGREIYQACDNALEILAARGPAPTSRAA